MSGGSSIRPLPNVMSEDDEVRLREEAERQAEAKRRMGNFVPDNSPHIENLHNEKAAPESEPTPAATPKPGDKMTSFFNKQKEEEDKKGRPIPPTPVYGGH